MIINIPNYKKIDIKNIVFDYNGTVAINGEISGYVKNKLTELSKIFNVSIVTADTYNTVRKNFKDLDINIIIISSNGMEDKLKHIKKINSENTIAVGNGNNDCKMLNEAIIGISVLNEEGLSKEALLASDIFMKNIKDVFSLLEDKNKIVAVLRK